MIIDNIFYYIEYKGVSAYEFSKKIAVSNGYLVKIRQNRGNVGGYILEKIVSCYPDLNPEWLLTGVGEMLKMSEKKSFLKESEVNCGEEIIHDLNQIPVLSNAISVSETDGSNLKKSLKYFDANVFFKNVTATIYVHDDSMFPEYKKGNIAFIKEVSIEKGIDFNKDYVIETNKYRVLKRIKKSNKPKFLFCNSLNKETYLHNNKIMYESFYIPKKDVVKVYLVLGSINVFE